jgi:MFS family permease
VKAPVTDSNQYKRVSNRLLPRWLNRNLSFLFLGRVLRSVSQGYLAIIVPFFMAELGYDAVHLGVLFTASAVASALLAAGIGMASDRFGRKSFLVVIPLMTAGGALTFAMSSNFVILVCGAALGTIGRGGGAGSGGAWGPYFPAEQALIAEQVSDAYRTRVFGALSFIGVISGAMGSLIAGVPHLLFRFAGVPLLDGYRTLFLFTVVLAVAMILSILPVREVHVPVWGNERASENVARASAPTAQGRRMLGMSRASWRLVSRFMVTNLTNGLAIGMLGPLMVYWFYRRYGTTAAQLGQLFFIINLLATVPYLMAGRMASWLGVVRTVVVGRGIASVLLAAMVFMPTFKLAAMLYAIRMLANVVAIPVRQSYLMGIIPPSERASAAGFASFPTQAGSALSPSFAGYMMEHVWLGAPLEMAAVLFAVYTVLYHYLFRDVRPPEEIDSEPAAAAK